MSFLSLVLPRLHSSSGPFGAGVTPMPDFRERVARAYDDLVALPRENLTWWLGVGMLASIVVLIMKGLV